MRENMRWRRWMTRRSSGSCAVSLGKVLLLVVVPKKGEQKAAKSGGCSQLNIFHFVDSFVHFVTFQRPFWTFIWMTYDENLSFFGLGWSLGRRMAEGEVLVSEICPWSWGSRWRLSRWDHEDWAASRDLKLKYLLDLHVHRVCCFFCRARAIFVAQRVNNTETPNQNYRRLCHDFF